MEKIIIVHIKGGIGNQLFQYALGYTISRMFDTTLMLDLSFYMKPEYRGVYKLDNFNISASQASDKEVKRLKNKPGGNKRVKKLLTKLSIPSSTTKKTHYGHGSLQRMPESLTSLKLPAYIEGWFNDPRLFAHMKNDLAKEFSLSLDMSRNIYYRQIKNSESVAIHYRRGDYVGNPVFNNLGKDYYEQAIDLILQRCVMPKFYIFSDSPEEARKDFSFLNNNAIIVETERARNSKFQNSADLEDFFLMLNCRHSIIANSTFSWWTAWLKSDVEKSTIIAPAIWYLDERLQMDYSNGHFIPNHWIKI